MRFAAVALLMATSTQAIRITQKSTTAVAHPDAKEIMEHCDTGKDGSIDHKEAMACMPKEWSQKQKDETWKMADADKSGKVDMKELEAALAKHDGKKLAQEGPTAQQIWDHCNTNKDAFITWAEARACGAPKEEKPFFDKFATDNKVDRKQFQKGFEAYHAREEKKLAQKKQPTAEQMWSHIQKHCDQDGDKTISWKEARGCGAPSSWEAEFNRVAGKDGRVDQAEFLKEARAHGLSLAQGPSAQQIWDHILKKCDKDDDKAITWKEASACGAPSAWEAKFLAVAGKDGKVDHSEFMAAAGHSLAQKGKKVDKKGPKPPSPEEVVAHCDKSGNGSLSQEEVFACIKAEVPEEEQAEMEADVKKHWKEVAGDDNEINAEELKAAMKAKKGGKK